jgi:predicted amidohydrolase
MAMQYLVAAILFNLASLPAFQTPGVWPVPYAQKPLEKPEITLKIVQFRAGQVLQKGRTDVELRRETDKNLQRMVSYLEQACTEGDKPDIVMFSEFPLTGLAQGSRDDVLRTAIAIPGPESEALGRGAKRCNAYVTFGAYAKDKDWPGHILSINTVLGRDGTIKKKFWKSRNIKRVFGPIELTTTTVESVRDRYQMLYGVDDAFSPLQTEFGNIVVSTVQSDPLVFAAFAARGAEILLRPATYYITADAIATAQYFNFYSAVANPPPTPGEWSSGVTMETSAGSSMLVAPSGAIVAKLGQDDEGILTVKIPVAEFRKGRTLPHLSWELTEPVLRTYQQEIPANHLDLTQDKLPKSGVEMRTYFDSISRWRSEANR